MKKLITILVTAAMLLSTLGIAAFAEGYRNPGVEKCTLKFDVKKANPDNVVKDGKIGDGEYEKLDIDLDIETTQIWTTFGANTEVTTTAAEALLGTMEYYFSWDDTHGFNFAIRAKSDVVRQVLGVNEGEKPGDDFMTQTGFAIAVDPALTVPKGQTCNFYYAIAKKTEGDGAYLQGHYKQFGYVDEYAPVAGTDFVIDYGTDGYATCEWSIPINVISPNPAAAGNELFVSISATATTDPTSAETDWDNIIGTSLGDIGFFVPNFKEKQHATAVLSDEEVSMDKPPIIDPPKPWPNPFIDVKEGDWFYDAVKYVNTTIVKNEKGEEIPIMGGQNAENTFEPKTGMNRAMLATLLWRLENCPAPKADVKFPDVTQGWCKNAIAWANETEIVKGTSDTTFEPLKTLTRQEIATMLFRYANYKKLDTSARDELKSFPDGSDVASWALEGVQWAVASKIIGGKSEGGKTILAAKVMSNRAEVAKMMMNYNDATK